MKQQRFRFKLLALMLTGLLVLLAFFGITSVMTYGNRWFSSSHNPRVRSQKQNVAAGSILDRSGKLLAWTDEDGMRRYQEDAAARSSVVHILGEPTGKVANGVETFQTGYLYGFHASFPELLGSLFSNRMRQGDTVVLTIDSRLCTDIAADFDRHSATKGKRGAVVVMNYRTGEVLAQVSLPSFDPEHITAATLNDAGKPFWNRATQSLYPPGSTFKVITAASALDHSSLLGDVTEETFTCTGALKVDSYVIHEFGDAVHGDLSLRRAFAQSCNSTFAQLALRLGDQNLRATAAAFGFGDNFLFRDLVVENSVYPAAPQTNHALAATGFGQSGLAATPMHMCMVAAAIANQGVMMEPRLLRQVNTPSGGRRAAFDDRVYRTALPADHAAILRDAMRAAVTGGTATKAAVSGLTVCGKTGTAESTLNGQPISYGWFIGFIDSDDLPFAVAVVVEDVPDGIGGGSTACPIAADIFRYLQAHAQLVME